MSSAKLPHEFYLQDTVTVARALLGCVLWRRVGRELLAARLVEVEAYLGANDMASHARRGLRSARNESMYLGGGHAYVYFTYGMHWCMNVVTQEADIAEAVLLRAAEPVQGIESMRARRPKAKRDVDLMNGPGKLCSALAIDRALDGPLVDALPRVRAGLRARGHGGLDRGVLDVAAAGGIALREHAEVDVARQRGLARMDLHLPDPLALLEAGHLEADVRADAPL